jgi:hypothetical protein
MYLSRKFYSNSSSISTQNTIRIRKSKIRIPSIKIPTQTEEEAMSEIGKFIDVRDSVIMHNHDERGFEYGVLSKLNPEKWGGKKLEEKDDPMYYGKDLELQAYAKEMIDKDANHTRGNIIRQHIIIKKNFNKFSRGGYIFSVY